MVDFAENAWAFRGQDGLDRSHVPAQPLWVAGLRVGQLVVGFIVFVLTAYAAGQLDYSGVSEPPATSPATLVLLARAR